MIEWINLNLGISNEVSVPTIVSIIVFLSGGLVSFLFNQFNSFSNRKINRKTFFLLLEYVIVDIKIKEKNVQELINQIELTYENGFSYRQKSITSLDSIFEFGFKEIYYSFRKKFFWSFLTKNLNYKAFHRIWDSLRELHYFETKINDHLNDFILNFDERMLNYISKLDVFIKSYIENKENFEEKRYLENNPMLLKYWQKEESIWLNWQNFDGNRAHYNNSYKYLISPLILLNHEFTNLKEGNGYFLELLRCANAYEEIKDAIETNNIIFSTYYKFYRNKNRLLKKCLHIIKI